MPSPSAVHAPVKGCPSTVPVTRPRVPKICAESGSWTQVQVSPGARFARPGSEGDVECSRVCHGQLLRAHDPAVALLSEARSTRRLPGHFGAQPSTSVSNFSAESWWATGTDGLSILVFRRHTSTDAAADRNSSRILANAGRPGSPLLVYRVPASGPSCGDGQACVGLLGRLRIESARGTEWSSAGWPTFDSHTRWTTAPLRYPTSGPEATLEP